MLAWSTISVDVGAGARSRSTIRSMGKAKALEHEKAAKEAQEEMRSIREAAEIYLADCAGRGNAASTIEAKRRKLANVLAVVGDARVAAPGEAEASRVRAAMREYGYAPTTINQTMNVFGMMLKRCHVFRLRATPPEQRLARHGPVTGVVAPVRRGPGETP